MLVRMEEKAMTQQHNNSMGHDIGLLIQELGPLNNRWRGENPASKVLTLWDMGDVLLRLVVDPNDQLLWNIQERSYITRTVLRYALIMRRGWAQRAVLERLVQGLQSYTIFREALPFLKGDHAGIDEETYRRVVMLLYDNDTQRSLAFLKHLKSHNINREHKKGASTLKVENEVNAFNSALVELKASISSAGENLSAEQRKMVVSLSQMTLAIATGETIKQIPSPTMSDDWTVSLYQPLVKVLGGGRGAISAFRKMIGADHLMQAADLLNSMRDERSFIEWRQRHSSISSKIPNNRKQATT